MANEKQAIQDAIDAGEVYIDDDGQDATEVPAGIKLNKTLIGSKVTPHEVYLYDDASKEEVNKQIDARIRRTGKSRYDGNINRFYRVYEVIDDEGNPTWHKHGMKTKHVRNLVTVDLSTGKTTTKHCSTFYKTVC